jgi:pyruvate kinase
MEALVKAGMDVARINASHGCCEEHAARIRRVREAASACGRQVGIMFDLAGPKIRTGPIKNGKVELAQGALVSLVPGCEEGDAQRVFVNYPDLLESVCPGARILLSDGLIELEVDHVRDGEVVCRVKTSGELASRKGVSLPGARVRFRSATRKDVSDIQFAAAQEVDFIASSFVQCAEDVVRVRALLDAAGADSHVIAKIESSEGIANIDAIIGMADGVMVARGDLGVETLPERVPLVQKMIIQKCNAAGKPVITATEMLESMVENPRPTRAEVTDVACAIFDGTDAVMLSAETAVGNHPIEAVSMMARIAETTEEALPYAEILRAKSISPSRSVADAISHATCQTAHDLGVKAILTSTESGATARMVSKYRPQAPIVAATPDPRVASKLTLAWGVLPTLVRKAANIDDVLDVTIEAAVSLGVASKGDLVIITAGVRAGVPGTTNMLKVHRV